MAQNCFRPSNINPKGPEMDMTIEIYSPVQKPTGFIEPIAHIKKASHAIWENTIDSLRELLKSHTLRSTIDSMPILPISSLNLEEIKRAYVILTMLSNAYLWGYHKDDAPNPVIPPCISVPLLQTCKILGMMPTACFGSVCIWNVKPRDDNNYNLDNMECVNIFTDTVDESHFYLVSSAIETRGVETISRIEELVNPTHNQSRQEILSILLEINKDINDFSDILVRMYEKCDPEIFFTQVRHYMNGSIHLDGALFKGYYEMDSHWEDICTSKEDGLYFKLHGGSAAQSPIIHLLDTFLGVSHFPTNRTGVNFIPLMRKYMYKMHRDYLDSMTSKCDHFRQEIVRLDLIAEFDILIESVKILRDKHLQMVTRYIINQSHKREESLGTGGMKTAMFLKQARQETEDAKFAKKE
eukprot:NODE_634_length_5185_cov_0.548565.p1 type:complete len:411 gc:universal NODE_634_length_5185_cov_0.548565:2939-1707(-)